MKPFIFQFRENPTDESIDHSLIEYDKKLNLSVNKITRQPAIDELNLVTETFTRSGEVSDLDNNQIAMLMATGTATKVGGEDTDLDRSTIDFMFLETETVTLEVEGADSDNTYFYNMTET
jgi:hypothetical protein